MIEAMVQLNPYQPWSNQKSIIVFDKSLVNQERIEADAISVYESYSYTPGIISGEEITDEDIYAGIKNNPNYFVLKQEGKKPKVKYISNINIEKWIKDPPGVYEKFEAGEYGNLKKKEKN